MQLTYKDGYRYQLVEDFVYKLPEYFIRPGKEIETDWIWLGQDRTLILKKGYACDGPSGPTFHTKNFIRGAFIHDCLYGLMREGHLDKNTYRPLADRILYDVIRQDGMSRFRAGYIYWGVRLGANPEARYGTEKPALTAP